MGCLDGAVLVMNFPKTFTCNKKKARLCGLIRPLCDVLHILLS